MNLRPSGYEPDELPDCSTPRHVPAPAGDRSTACPGSGRKCVRASKSGSRDRPGSRESGSCKRGPCGRQRPAEPARHGLARPGSDLLSHALRRSTIGAEGLHGRVRNGIGCFPLAVTTRPCKPTDADFRKFHNRGRLLDGPCRTGGRTTVRVQPVRPRHNKSWHGRMRVERRLRNTAFSAACAVFRPGPFGTGEGTSRSSD